MSERSKAIVPLALTATEIILDIVDCITRSGITLAILGSLEFATEDLVVLFLRDLVDDNLPLVISDLEDDELGLGGLVAAHAEVVECSDALICDRDTTAEKVAVSMNAQSVWLVPSRRRNKEKVQLSTYPDASCEATNTISKCASTGESELDNYDIPTWLPV